MSGTPGQFRDRPGKGLDPCSETEEAGPGIAQLNTWVQPSPGTCRQRFLGVPPYLGPLAGSGTVLAKAWTPARKQKKPGREWIPCVSRPRSVPSKPPSVRSPGHRRSSGQPGCWEGWAWRPRPSSLTAAPFFGAPSVCWLPVRHLTRLHPRPLHALPSDPAGPLCIPLRHRMATMACGYGAADRAGSRRH